MQRSATRPSTTAFIDAAYRHFSEKILQDVGRPEYAKLARTTCESIVLVTTEMLRVYKEEIIARVFFHLDLGRGHDLNDEQRIQFQNMLENDVIDSFVHLPCFFEKGDELEKLHNEMSREMRNRVTARNYLRVFLRGSQVGADNAWFWESPLATPELFQTIMVKGDPDLESGVRYEIQDYFDRAFHYVYQLTQPKNDEEKPNDTRKKQLEKRFQSHLGPLITSMAFFKYPDDAEVYIPVKVKNPETGIESWQKVKYRITKFDISPQPGDGGLDGILGRLLRPEDRFYIYGFEPVDSLHANPILAWSGTPPDGVAGSDVATTYNVIGGKAIAEAHNTQQVRRWIKAQKNKIVSYGHSKGGMGQIFVAEYPDHFKSFEGLCGGLHSATLKRLTTTPYGQDNLTWEDRVHQSKTNPAIHLPKVTIHDQQKDVVFSMDRGFLPGTEIRHVLTSQKPALNAYPIPQFFAEGFQHHSFSLLGHPDVIFLKGNVEIENKRPLRSFLDTGKNILGYFVGFQKKSQLIIKLLRRELNEFCAKYRTPLLTALFLATLSIEIFLLTSGVGAGFSGYLTAFFLKIFPLSTKAASVLSTASLSAGSVAVSAGLSYAEVIPKVLNVAFDLVFTGLDILYTLITRTITLVAATPSAIKNLSLSLYKDQKPLKDLGNYLISLQLVPDLISGVLSVVKGIGKGLFYILPNLIWWKINSSSVSLPFGNDSEKNNLKKSSSTTRLLRDMPPLGESQTAASQSNVILTNSASIRVPPVVMTPAPSVPSARRFGFGGCTVS